MCPINIKRQFEIQIKFSELSIKIQSGRGSGAHHQQVQVTDNST